MDKEIRAANKLRRFQFDAVSTVYPSWRNATPGTDGYRTSRLVEVSGRRYAPFVHPEFLAANLRPRFNVSRPATCLSGSLSRPWVCLLQGIKYEVQQRPAQQLIVGNNEAIRVAIRWDANVLLFRLKEIPESFEQPVNRHPCQDRHNGLTKLNSIQ